MSPVVGLGHRLKLWGDEVKIDDVAAAAGTVGYELRCARWHRECLL
ncbi:hypothetical protein ACVXG7_15550 [Enterobacter hormaechei]